MKKRLIVLFAVMFLGCAYFSPVIYCESEPVQENNAVSENPDSSNSPSSETSEKKPEEQVTETPQKTQEKAPIKKKKPSKNTKPAPKNTENTNQDPPTDEKSNQNTEPASQNKILLPEIDYEKALSNETSPKSKSEMTGSKLAKGIISFFLIISGIFIIIWVILKNRRIPREKAVRLKNKKGMYYKNSKRK